MSSELQARVYRGQDRLGIWPRQPVDGHEYDYPDYPWAASAGLGHRRVFRTLGEAVEWLARECADERFEEPPTESVSHVGSH